MGPSRLLYSTWPDAETAAQCARDLIEKRLAACAAVLPGARTIYRWQGKLQDDAEAVMLVKTARPEAARDAILAAHPYDLPCVLALTPDEAASNPLFLEWVEAESSPPPFTGEG